MCDFQKIVQSFKNEISRESAYVRMFAQKLWKSFSKQMSNQRTFMHMASQSEMYVDVGKGN